MAESLPTTTEIKLRQTLLQWSAWSCAEPLNALPEVVGQLSQGLSNHSVLVGQAGQRFVVRIDRVDPQKLGLNRSAEWRALGHAHAAGLAPEPVYFNPDIGTLVTRYCEPQTGGVHGLKDIAGLLRGIHALPVIHFRLNLKSRLRLYQHTMLNNDSTHDEEFSRELLSAQPRIAELLEDLSPSRLCLCHNDLLRANRINVNSRLLALDWEYAAMGDPYLDLAMIVVGDGLDLKQTNELLQHYSQSDSEIDSTRTEFTRLCALCSYMDLMWYAATDTPLDSSEQAHKLQVLRDLLDTT